MTYEHIIVGSGINSLVCAALLAKRGAKICLVERNDWLGGAIRSGEITAPGYQHDIMCCWYPLFVTSPGFGELAVDLARQGVTFATARHPTATMRSDQSSFILRQDRLANIHAMNRLCAGDGDRYAASMGKLEENLDFTFKLLSAELWSPSGLALLLKQLWCLKPKGLAAYFGDAFETCRSWTDRTLDSSLIAATLAPWVLHTGLGPDATMSGLMARVIAFTLEQVGMPVVAGGGGQLTAAFDRMIRSWGGDIRLNWEARSIIVESGRATGVVGPNGEQIRASRSVICNVPPPQLYGKLLESGDVPGDVADDAKRYRFGRACMQIHVALSSPARWTDPALDETSIVHITDGLDAVTRSVAAADAGYLPADATIVVGQPHLADPGRVPAGGGSLWIQLQELPRHVRGDAAGRIASPQDGRWNDSIAEAYADRVMERIGRHIPGLASKIVARTVVSPAALEAMNPNLVGGDPYCGDCSTQQFAIWRPLRTPNGHRTHVDRLWHIGASTHPGPGLGGGSGFLVANALSR